MHIKNEKHKKHTSIDESHGGHSNSFRIPFHRIAYDGAEEAAVQRVLKRGWITSGTECIQLEEEFAHSVNAAHAVSLSSATAGLHLALLLGDLPPNSAVALSPLTFVSCAHVILQSGLRPLFIDIAPGSFHMDPSALEAQILASRNSKHPVSAIMCVHYAGEARFIERYTALAKQYNLWLIEDAAHCAPIVGESYRYPAKDAAVFSFYATKPLSAAEGGMLCLQDSQLAQRARMLRSHGISQQSWHRYKNQSSTYDVIAQGFKYNLSDIQAALARVQLQKQQLLQNRREVIAQCYHALLQDTEHIMLPKKIHPLHSWHLFVIQINTQYRTRDQIVGTLKAAGIQSSIHFTPLHHQPGFKQFAPKKLTEVDAIADRILSLPIFPDLKTDEIHYIASCIHKNYKL